jgi:hypothetical protein
MGDPTRERRPAPGAAPKTTATMIQPEPTAEVRQDWADVSDRAWQLAAARGEIASEAALLYVRSIRAIRSSWEHRDPEMAQALEGGDAARPDTKDRWIGPEGEQFGPPPTVEDTSATPELDLRTAGLALVPASTVRMDRPYWAWDRRIPVGGVTLMPGREGLGKTGLTCWAMARLTRGQLPGRWWARPAEVVYIGTEDDRASVLVPRLVAAGADLDRVHFVDLPDGMAFSVGVDTPVLTAALAGRDVALVVVDPLDGHLHGVDTHRKSEVQQSVARLGQLAQTVRCGALGLGHMNKGDARDFLARVVGSVGFTTSVRSVLGVGEHPDDPAERVCVVAKANMTDKAAVPALRFRMEEAHVDHPDGGDPIATGLAVILGEVDGIDPDAVIDRGDWLNDALADGPVAKQDILRRARAEGIAKSTLERAAPRVGVEYGFRTHDKGRYSVWSLGVTSTPPEATPQEVTPSTPAEQGELVATLPNPGGSPQTPQSKATPLDGATAPEPDDDEEW